MPKDKIILNCFFCKRDFQHGPQIYDGCFLKCYNLMACRSCYESNWDGWNPRHEKSLFEHLKKEGITQPRKNTKGWIPREV